MYTGLVPQKYFVRKASKLLRNLQEFMGCLRHIQHAEHEIREDYQESQGQEGHSPPEKPPMGILYYENIETELSRPHPKSSPS